MRREERRDNVVVVVHTLVNPESAPDVQPIADLAKHERHMLRCIAKGDCNKAIASSLNISLRSLERKRATLMQRFGVKTCPELICRATKAGIV